MTDELAESNSLGAFHHVLKERIEEAKKAIAILKGFDGKIDVSSSIAYLEGEIAAYETALMDLNDMRLVPYDYDFLAEYKKAHPEPRLTTDENGSVSW